MKLLLATVLFFSATTAVYAADEVSCQESLAPAAYQELVNDCLMESAATHPMCRAAVPCAEILENIVYYCTFSGEWSTDETCAKYNPNNRHN